MAYTLQVFHAGKPAPSAIVHSARASEVLDLIPKLLAEHAGCSHIDVLSQHVKLFSVDCNGNTTR